MTKAIRWIARASTLTAALAMAVPASAGMTGYLKLPDIDGESKSTADGVETEDIGFKPPEGSAGGSKEGTSDSERPAYIKIKMTRASTAKDSQHTEWIPVEAVAWGRGAAPVRQARDAASGQATGKRQHKPMVAARPAQVAAGSPSAAAPGMGGAGTVNSDRIRSNKMSTQQVILKQTMLPQRGTTGPGWVRLPVTLDGCRVGAHYPHAIVGDDDDGEVALLDVRVAQCAKEHVTLNYEKVQWPD